MQGLMVLLWLLAALTSADVNPGSIGLEFLGNEYAFTRKIGNFPTMEFTLTLRLKATGGHLLNYGAKNPDGTFNSNVLSLLNSNSLAIVKGGQPWSTLANFADNQWHALAISWKMSTGEMKLYKDGLLVASTVTGKGTLMPVDGYLMLGQIQTCPMGCFTAHTGLVGTVAAITLWQRALTPAQVQYLATDLPVGDESDLVSYWPLAESFGTMGKDVTRSANAFTLGGPHWVTDVPLAAVSHALALHKDGVVAVTPSNDLASADFTLEFWIKSSVREDSTVFAYYDTTAANPYPLRVHNPGLLTVDINGEVTRTETNVATGAWTHAAVSWTASTGRVRVYLNGVLNYPPRWIPESDYHMMPTTALGSTLPARPARLLVGSLMDCTVGSCLVDGAAVDASLLDVRLWNVVRTAPEIAQWKDALLPRSPAPIGLVLNLLFDEKEGSLAKDASGRGNNGVLTQPIWQNNKPAPPFPTLDSVNEKIADLRRQMAELMDVLTDTLEAPAIVQKDESSGAIPEPPKCDRRYKYLCAMKFENSSDVAAPTASHSVANANVLIQRAMGRSRHHHEEYALQLSGLSPEDEEVPVISAFHQNALDEANELLEIESGRVPPSPQPHGDKSRGPASPPPRPPVAAPAPSAPERLRHAWAVQQTLPAHPPGPVPPPRSVSPPSPPHATVTQGRPVRSSHLAQGTGQPPHVRHPWAAGHTEAIVRPRPRTDDMAGAGVAEFIQEAEGVGEGREEGLEMDDDMPEQLARGRAARPVPVPRRLSVADVVELVRAPAASAPVHVDGDVDAMEREFEKEREEFEHFGELPDLAADHSFDSTPPVREEPDEDVEDSAFAAVTRGTVLALQQGAGRAEAEDSWEGTPPAYESAPDFDGSIPEPSDAPRASPSSSHHHHHHHRGHHHSSRSRDSEAVSAPPPTAKDVPARVAAAAAAAARSPQQLRGGQTNSGARPFVANERMQVAIEGSESEWTQALAEGISGGGEAAPARRRR